MPLNRRSLLALLPAPFLARPALALPAAHAVLLFPHPARGTVPGQHAEGEGRAGGVPLGRFALAAPPLSLPDAPLAVLFDDAQALRPLLNAGRWAFAPPARALVLEGAAPRPLALEGAWLLRLGDGPRPAAA